MKVHQIGAAPDQMAYNVKCMSSSELKNTCFSINTHFY